MDSMNGKTLLVSPGEAGKRSIPGDVAPERGAASSEPASSSDDEILIGDSGEKELEERNLGKTFAREGLGLAAGAVFAVGKGLQEGVKASIMNPIKAMKADSRILEQKKKEAGKLSFGNRKMKVYADIGYIYLKKASMTGASVGFAWIGASAGPAGIILGSMIGPGFVGSMFQWAEGLAEGTKQGMQIGKDVSAKLERNLKGFSRVGRLQKLLGKSAVVGARIGMSMVGSVLSAVPQIGMKQWSFNKAVSGIDETNLSLKNKMKKGIRDSLYGWGWHAYFWGMRAFITGLPGGYTGSFFASGAISTVVGGVNASVDSLGGGFMKGRKAGIEFIDSYLSPKRYYSGRILFPDIYDNLSFPEAKAANPMGN